MHTARRAARNRDSGSPESIRTDKVMARATKAGSCVPRGTATVPVELNSHARHVDHLAATGPKVLGDELSAGAVFRVGDRRGQVDQHRHPIGTVAEFFAGVGLVRMGLAEAGFEVVFANDISSDRFRLYAANFGSEHFALCDIRDLSGRDVPEVELATASFPCIDLSLAGNRAGLSGNDSGLYWEFVRLLGEMGQRRPGMILVENVIGFGLARRGADRRLSI